MADVIQPVQAVEDGERSLPVNGGNGGTGRAATPHSARRDPPASRRVYVPGTRPDVRVPVREVDLSGGNPPVRLYDTSGPHGD
ncbi:MAG: hypothetical protein ACRDJO_05535, partial [Actinomycetota bacterium]